MTVSKHKTLLSTLVAEKIKKKRTKGNHTLYLDTDNFLSLRAFCKEHQVTPSEVMDKLLAGFVEDALAEGTLTGAGEQEEEGEQEQQEDKKKAS